MTIKAHIARILHQLAADVVRVDTEVQGKYAGLLDTARKSTLVAPTCEAQRAGYEAPEGIEGAFRDALLGNFLAIQPAVYYKDLDNATGKVVTTDAKDPKATKLTAEYCVKAIGDTNLRKIPGTRGDLTTYKGIVCNFRDNSSTHVSRYVKLIERLARGEGSRGGTAERLEWNEKMDPKNKKGLARKVFSACESHGYNAVAVKAAWAQFLKDLDASLKTGPSNVQAEDAAESEAEAEAA